jgi:hypothetical protein
VQNLTFGAGGYLSAGQRSRGSILLQEFVAQENGPANAGPVGGWPPQRNTKERGGRSLVLDRRRQVRLLRKFPVQRCLSQHLTNATNFVPVLIRLLCTARDQGQGPTNVARWGLFHLCAITLPVLPSGHSPVAELGPSDGAIFFWRKKKTPTPIASEGTLGPRLVSSPKPNAFCALRLSSIRPRRDHSPSCPPPLLQDHLLQRLNRPRSARP